MAHHVVPDRSLLWPITYSGRYQDVIDLANKNLTERIIATAGRSKKAGSGAPGRNMPWASTTRPMPICARRSTYHPGFQAALDMLALWGVSP